MKAQVLQENLIKGISAVSRVTASGGKIPILANILIKAEKTGLVLIGTNLEIATIVKVGAKVDKEGEFTVPAKILSEFLTSLNPGKIELVVKDEKLSLSSGLNKASFQGVGAKEFPETGVNFNKQIFSYKKGIENDISQVVFAAAIDENRPVLTGVQFKREDDLLRLVATDGYRLSIKKIKVDFNSKKDADWEAIIPAKTLTELIYLKKSFKHEGEVLVKIADEGNQIGFSFGEVTLTSRIIEGEFPAFEQIVPAKGDSIINCIHGDLLAAVRRAAIFARESANIVKIEIKGKQLTVSANSPQVGKSDSVIDIVCEGEGGKIAFNSRYLVEFLTSIEKEGKEVELEITGPLSPGLFKIKGEDQFKHVIMPVRVQE